MLIVDAMLLRTYAPHICHPDISCCLAVPDRGKAPYQSRAEAFRQAWW